MYNPASEGLEAAVGDETQYALGSDSEEEEGRERDSAEEDERRGFHREHKAVQDEPSNDLQNTLETDAQLLELDAEGKELEESMSPHSR